MADERKGAVQAALDWITNHWGEVFTLWHVAGGNKAPDSAPAWVKAAEVVAVGGKGRPEDEATWLRLKQLLGTMADGTKRQDAKGLVLYLQSMVTEVFDLNHDEEWKRRQGQQAFEEWRVVLTQMFNDDRRAAVEYITGVAVETSLTYVGMLRAKAGKAGKPVSALANRQKQACWKATCVVMKDKLRNDGIPMASGIKPYRVRLRDLIDKLGPTANDVWDKVKTEYPGWRDYAKDLADNGWGHVTEQARKADRKVAIYARHRKIKDANRPWYIRWIDALL